MAIYRELAEEFGLPTAKAAQMRILYGGQCKKMVDALTCDTPDADTAVDAPPSV
jgi:hypothetical protein